jgi:hypothetical protein
LSVFLIDDLLLLFDELHPFLVEVPCPLGVGGKCLVPEILDIQLFLELDQLLVRYLPKLDLADHLVGCSADNINILQCHAARDLLEDRIDRLEFELHFLHIPDFWMVLKVAPPTIQNQRLEEKYRVHLLDLVKWTGLNIVPETCDLEFAEEVLQYLFRRTLKSLRSSQPCTVAVLWQRRFLRQQPVDCFLESSFVPDLLGVQNPVMYKVVQVGVEGDLKFDDIVVVVANECFSYPLKPRILCFQF